MLFGRKGTTGEAARGRAAVAGARPEVAQARELADRGDLDGGVALLTEANRADRDLELEREIRRFRHLAGVQLLADPVSAPSYAEAEGELPRAGMRRRGFPRWRLSS